MAELDAKRYRGSAENRSSREMKTSCLTETTAEKIVTRIQPDEDEKEEKTGYAVTATGVEA